MTRKPETLLTRRILQRLNDYGGFWVKIAGSQWQQTGLPDIVGCYEGGFYGFEVKLEKGKLTARQALTLKTIAERGKGTSAVVYGPDDAMTIVKQRRFSHIDIFSGKTWLSSSQACVKIGLGMGKDKPISEWKLKELIKAGTIESRTVGNKVYYRSKSIDTMLRPLRRLA